MGAKACQNLPSEGMIGSTRLNMATVSLSRQSASAPSQIFRILERRPVWLTGLSALIFLVHGFHPYADDAGIYVAGIQKLIDPSLYSADAIFVVSHTRLSVFAHLLAGLARLTHLPLEWLLLLIYIGSLALFVEACRQLATRLFLTTAARNAAVLLSGALFTLPVAGTALSIMDPYVTARSLSTPFSLLAVAACLGRSTKGTLLWLLLTAVTHPLMAVYLGAFLLVLSLSHARRWRLLAGVCCAAVLLCGLIFFSQQHAVVLASYREAVTSRTYFYLGDWAWFELLGLYAPILLLAVAARRLGLHSASGKLCLTSVAAGATSTLCCLFFVHTSGPFFLARLQMLRSFQLIYATGIVLLGGFLGHLFSRRSRWLGCMLIAIAFLSMYAAERQSYGNSAHLELPGRTPKNQWEQAFLWIRGNTPHEAVVAADPAFLSAPGEDAQSPRALSERSVLGNFKDEGVAAIFPAAAPAWKIGWDAQLGIDAASDRERYARLHPLGADWLVLPATARTAFPCPYRNPRVAVCHSVP